MTENLTVGERVAWYRRRRGMSQEVLAGLIGRTEDWLQRAEHNRIQLDRLSVIRSLAYVLDVSIGDLIGEPMLLDWTADSRTQTVPALRAVPMDYGQLSPLLASDTDSEPPELDQLARLVGDVFDAYQHSRFGYVTATAPRLLRDTVIAARTADGDAAVRAHELLGLSYQAAASVLTKLGEADLAWIAAERGLTAAERTDSKVVLGSLFRSVAHTLLSTGRFQPAVQLVDRAAAVLASELGTAEGPMLSVTAPCSLPAPWPRPAPRIAQRRARSCKKLSRRPVGSAPTLTTCGPRSARRTSPFTGSTRRWNSATCRSPSTSALGWTPRACRPSGGSGMRSTWLGLTAPAIGVMKGWPSSWTPSGWRRNRCATTTSAASWC
jgi:transcriptional regulator with XRE-family HTH domain